MAAENVALYAFNRGLISRLGLARTDVKRTALSSQLQNNYMPRVLGSMMFRPGLAYVDGIYNNVKAVHVPFVFSLTDTAIIELTDQLLRVRVDEQIITRASVSTAITNGNFSGDILDWTDADQAGATSVWAAGNYMQLTGNGFSYATRYQPVTIAAPDQATEHALRIVVKTGNIILRVGTSVGGDTLINQTTLGPGIHSLAFTPNAATIYVQFQNAANYPALLQSCNVEAAGAMTIVTPWLAADLPLVRYDQSADIIYVASDSTTIVGGYQQYKIERRGTHSWSVVQFLADDGPFEIENSSPTALTPSALTGQITISASNPTFYPTHVGALFRLASIGQNINENVGGADQFSDPIQVTGLSNQNPGDPAISQRAFTINISGTWAGTVTLQRSVGEPGAWIDVTTYTTNQTNLTYDDALDNQIIFYRLGFESGNYSSGSADVQLAYSSGSLTGIARITGYTNSQSVTANVLKPMGALLATTQWWEGMWSTYRGYPTSVLLYEGRLCWSGRDNFQGSVSDAYQSYDDTIVGDSGPLLFAIGSGPLDSIHWMLPLQAIVMGGGFGEHFILSNTLQEPLTPTDFNIKTYSTQGSASVAALKKDLECIFLQRSGQRIFTVSFNPIYLVSNIDELTAFCPDVTGGGTSSQAGNLVEITKMAIQRQPDTRIHCIRSDGTVAVLVYDKLENVQAWITLSTPNGVIEDIIIMPGIAEELIYYSVRRVINGQAVRYLERFALESECVGGTLSKNVDSHVVLTHGSPSTAIAAPSLAGETCAFWADGVAQDNIMLDASGNGTAAAAFSSGVIGIPYTAQFKSSKLAYQVQGGTALNQKKKIDQLGLILQDTHPLGLKYGIDFDHLYNMPQVEGGTAVDLNQVYSSYDQETFEFEGQYDTDSRLCLQSQSPYPCTILAAIIGLQTNEKF